MSEPLVSIIMGSQSDWDTMQAATTVLTELGVPFETRVVSAHRTPARLVEFAEGAASRGLKVIIAGAGGAAHLAGMAASMTHLPVIAVPVSSKQLKGMEVLYLNALGIDGAMPPGPLQGCSSTGPDRKNTNNKDRNMKIRTGPEAIISTTGPDRTGKFNNQTGPNFDNRTNINNQTTTRIDSRAQELVLVPQESILVHKN